MYIVAKYGDCVGMKKEDSTPTKEVQMIVRRRWRDLSFLGNHAG